MRPDAAQTDYDVREHAEERRARGGIKECQRRLYSRIAELEHELAEAVNGNDDLVDELSRREAENERYYVHVARLLEALEGSWWLAAAASYRELEAMVKRPGSQRILRADDNSETGEP